MSTNFALALTSISVVHVIRTGLTYNTMTYKTVEHTAFKSLISRSAMWPTFDEASFARDLLTRYLNSNIEPLQKLNGLVAATSSCLVDVGAEYGYVSYGNQCPNGYYYDAFGSRCVSTTKCVDSCSVATIMDAPWCNSCAGLTFGPCVSNATGVAYCALGGPLGCPAGFQLCSQDGTDKFRVRDPDCVPEEFEALVPTPTSDRLCEVVNHCSRDAPVTLVPPSRSSNRVCSSAAVEAPPPPIPSQAAAIASGVLVTLFVVALGAFAIRRRIQDPTLHKPNPLMQRVREIVGTELKVDRRDDLHRDIDVWDEWNAGFSTELPPPAPFTRGGDIHPIAAEGQGERLEDALLVVNTDLAVENEKLLKSAIKSIIDATAVNAVTARSSWKWKSAKALEEDRLATDSIPMPPRTIMTYFEPLVEHYEAKEAEAAQQAALEAANMAAIGAAQAELLADWEKAEAAQNALIVAARNRELEAAEAIRRKEAALAARLQLQQEAWAITDFYRRDYEEFLDEFTEMYAAELPSRYYSCPAPLARRLRCFGVFQFGDVLK